MKSNLRIAGFLILAILLGTGIILIGRIILADCSNTEDYIVVENEFVSQVWPPPKSSVPIKCYLSSADPVFHQGEGVGVTLVSARIDENWQSPPQIPIESRGTAYVDGNELSERAEVIYQLSLEYCDEESGCVDTGRPAGINMIWKPLLLIGQHEATVLVENDAGRTLEFSWTFTITW